MTAWRQWAAWMAEAVLWGVCVLGALDSAGETMQCINDGGEPRFMEPCQFDEPVKLRHDDGVRYR